MMLGLQQQQHRIRFANVFEFIDRRSVTDSILLHFLLSGKILTETMWWRNGMDEKKAVSSSSDSCPS